MESDKQVSNSSQKRVATKSQAKEADKKRLINSKKGANLLFKEKLLTHFLIKNSLVKSRSFSYYMYCSASLFLCKLLYDSVFIPLYGIWETIRKKSITAASAYFSAMNTISRATEEWYRILPIKKVPNFWGVQTHANGDFYSRMAEK